MLLNARVCSVAVKESSVGLLNPANLDSLLSLLEILLSFGRVDGVSCSGIALAFKSTNWV